MTEDMSSDVAENAGMASVTMKREGLLGGHVVVTGMVDWTRFWPACFTAYRSLARCLDERQRREDGAAVAGLVNLRVEPVALAPGVWTLWAYDRDKMTGQEFRMMCDLLSAQVLPSALDRVRDWAMLRKASRYEQVG